MMFNWTYYINKNPDIAFKNINCERDAFVHWIKYGKYEMRLYVDIPIYFNWKIYLQLNNLTSIKNEDDAWKHFLYNGNNPNIRINNPELKIYCV